MQASRLLFAAVAGLGVFFASELSAGVTTRLGVEFQINTFTGSFQRAPAAAMDDQGRFVVVWLSIGQDGNGGGIFGRRFDAAGVALATEFQVNSYTAGSELFPAVAMRPDGAFVVVWRGEHDGSETGVFARRFDASGAGLGPEFKVNAFTPGSQDRPSVGIEQDGDFVVAWEDDARDGSSYGIFFRRFDASGAPVAAEFQANNYTAGTQGHPEVRMNRSGAFVIAWHSEQDGDGFGVFAKRFNSFGNGYGEFKANAFTPDSQAEPAVGVSSDGRFVVTWQSDNQDGEELGIFARRFISAGGGLSSDFLVNTYTFSEQVAPALSMAPDGDFLVTWYGFEDGSGYGVFLRRFNSTGAALESALTVNSHTPDNQQYATVATGDGGDFIVVWESGGQDGSDAGVFAQRFRDVAALDVDGNGAVEPLNDGLLTLRFEFGFTGAALVTGAIDPVKCLRCTPIAIVEYLQSQKE